MEKDKCAENDAGHLRSVLLRSVCPVTTQGVEDAYQNPASKVGHSSKILWDEHSLVEVDCHGNLFLHSRVQEIRE